MQKFQHLRINRLYIGMFYPGQSTNLLGVYRKQYVRKDNKIFYKISLLFNGNPKTGEKSYKITVKNLTKRAAQKAIKNFYLSDGKLVFHKRLVKIVEGD